MAETCGFAISGNVCHAAHSCPRALWIIAFILSLPFHHAHAEDRAFSVRDSIEMTTFSDPSSLIQNSMASSSPNKKYFLVVTSRGVIKTNEIESTLWEFDADEVRRYLLTANSPNPPRPRLLARVAAIPRKSADRPNAPVISNLRWTDDSRWVYFLGDDSEGRSRLYRVHPDANGLEGISQPGLNITHFGFAAHLVAYTTSQAASASNISRDLPGYSINMDSQSITGLPLDSILFPIRGIEPQVSSLWIWRDGIRHEIQHNGVPLRIVDRDDYSIVLSISPSGLYAVWSLPVEKIPLTWELYTPPPGFEHRRISASDPNTISPFNGNRPREYTLINLRNGEATPLIDAPQGSAILYGGDTSKAVWSREGNRLVVTNTLLPLEGVDDQEREKRLRPCAAVSIDIPSRETQCIIFTRDSPVINDHDAAVRLDDVSFLGSNDDVLLTFATGDHQTAHEQYDYTQFHRWIRRGNEPDTPEAVNSLSLIVKQTLNEAPSLWAIESKDRRARELWNPNPELHHLEMGEASLYRWKGKDQYEWNGVLVKPVGYLPGARYPLVIQTHGYAPDSFITDGQFPTAMAARPLASEGIMVLQIGHRQDHLETQLEAEDQIDGIESAIQSLKLGGLVDSSKVGIIGFSRTCWYVEKALIRKPELFAAATIADGIDYSYMQYMLFGEARTIVEKSYEKVNGSTPFGGGLENWISNAASFHLDAVRTPMRIEAIGPASLLQEWEIYSALRRQRKAVDLIYIPDGQHILQKPLDRLASQQGNVDWFRFWLDDYQDPAPSKQKQYLEWEAMRQAAH